MPSIRSSADLRNQYNEISTFCHEYDEPVFITMSLDAKVAYTFLLNRFQLSRRNGWVNDFGEVFVIFPRKELARELRICEQRVTAAFRTLKELNLIWEKRCGRGDASQASKMPMSSASPSARPSARVRGTDGLTTKFTWLPWCPRTTRTTPAPPL